MTTRRDWLIVEVADDPPATADPAWVDVSDRVVTQQGPGVIVDARRGRERETDRVGAATGRIRLNNRDGALGDSVPLRVMAHVRVRVTVDGDTRPLFRGYIDRTRAVYGDPYRRTVEVSLVDAFEWLSSVPVDIERPREPSGARVAAVLDAVGWPEALRDLDDGVVDVLARPDDEDDAIPLTTEAPGGDVRAAQVLQDAADAEAGILYVASDGTIRYRDRHHRLGIDTVATFTPSDYGEVDAAVDVAELVTVAEVERADGTIVRVARDDAVDAYGERLVDPKDIDADIIEAEAAALWDLVRYSEPVERVEPIDLVCADADVLAVLDREVSDRVTITRDYPEGAGDDLDEVIEGIRHEVRSGGIGWQTRLWLAPHHGDRPWLCARDDSDEPDDCSVVGDDSGDTVDGDPVGVLAP